MSDSSEEDEDTETGPTGPFNSYQSSLIDDFRLGGRFSQARKPRGGLVRMSFLKSGGVWFVWDPCGIACAVITYLLILYGEFVMLTVLAPPFFSMWMAMNVIVFTGLGSLAVVAHVRSMITDPVSGRERGQGNYLLGVWHLVTSI